MCRRCASPIRPASKFGRFESIRRTARPISGPDAAQSAAFLGDELAQRLATGPVKMRVVVQMAAPGDEVADSTGVWPEDRPQVEFGTITLTKRVDAADPEMRKIIFDPIPRVDGIDPSDDPLFAVRAALYLFSGRRRRAAIQ